MNVKNTIAKLIAKKQQAGLSEEEEAFLNELIHTHNKEPTHER